MSAPLETRLREAAPRVVAPLDHAGLQRRGRHRRRARRAVQGAGMALLVGVAVMVGTNTGPTAAPSVEPMAQPPGEQAVAWPTVSSHGVDYRLWPTEEAPVDDLALVQSDFDPGCAWVLAFRLPSGERGGWSICPEPVVADTVGAWPLQMRNARGETAGVVVIFSSDAGIREVEVGLTDGSTHVVSLVDMARLDPDVPLQVGLLPKPFGVEVEAVGDLGWSWFG